MNIELLNKIEIQYQFDILFDRFRKAITYKHEAKIMNFRIAMCLSSQKRRIDRLAILNYFCYLIYKRNLCLIFILVCLIIKLNDNEAKFITISKSHQDSFRPHGYLQLIITTQSPI